MRYIVSDEIGVAFGAVGEWRLKSTQTPVYGRDRGLLAPQAIEGGLVGCLAGSSLRIEGPELEARIGRPLLAILQIVLPVHNHQFAGADQIDLFLSLEPRLLARPSLIERAVATLNEVDLAADRIVGFVDASVQLTPPCRRSLAILKDGGVRLALTNVLGSQDVMAAVSNLGASCVRLDADWLRTLGRSAAGVRLLRSFVNACHDEGWVVAAPSLNSWDEILLAYSAGFDLFQGDILAPASLTGTLIDMTPRSALSNVSGGPTIVPFPASRRAGKKI